MFKPRRQRQQTGGQNPLTDMEQFYLHQYFQPQSSHPVAPPPMRPHPNQLTDQRFPPPQMAKLQQLELRIARIEQYLGLPQAESSPESSMG